MSLLLTPNPLENESLSSYLYRLSKINACNTSWLLNYAELNYLNNLEAFTFTTNPRYISKLSSITNKSVDDITNMTIHKFSFNLWDTNKKTFRRDRKFLEYVDTKNHYFCPHCINENPYERLYWLLIPIQLCIKHSCFLIKTCSFCGSPTTTLSLSSGKCINCDYSLCQIPTIHCDDEKFIQFQNHAYFALGLNDSFKCLWDTQDSTDLLYNIFEYSETIICDGAVVYNINKLSCTPIVHIHLPDAYSKRK